MKELRLTHAGTCHTVKVIPVEGGYTVTIGDVQYTVNEYQAQSHVVTFRIDDVKHIAYVARSKGTHYVTVEGENYVFETSNHTSVKGRGPDVQQGNSVGSPMPGLVVKITVAVGDRVKTGATLVIVEAMKMQNEIKSPQTCRLY